MDEAGWDAGALRHEEAVALLQAGRLEEAEAAAREALATLEAALPGGHPDSANAMDTLASILSARGQPVAAVEHWRRALATFDGFASEPVVAEMRLSPLQHLGHALTLTGDFGPARALLEEAIREAARIHGPADLRVADGYNLLGVCHKLEGHLDQAEAAYGEAAARFDERGLARPATLCHNLAGLAVARGDHASAEALARQAIGARQGEPAEAAFLLGSDMVGLADALAGQARLQEAEATYREALDLYRRAGHGDHFEVAYALHNLAGVLARLGRVDEAVQGYREAIARLKG